MVINCAVTFVLWASIHEKLDLENTKLFYRPREIVKHLIILSKLCTSLPIKLNIVISGNVIASSQITQVPSIDSACHGNLICGLWGFRVALTLPNIENYEKEDGLVVEYLDSGDAVSVFRSDTKFLCGLRLVINPSVLYSFIHQKSVILLAFLSEEVIIRLTPTFFKNFGELETPASFFLGWEVICLFALGFF